MIRDLIKNKNSRELANIKATEIAKLNFIGEHHIGNYKIDITAVNKIDGGIEIFARAWEGNKQLGFGSDGSVEIERFRIFNPPILVQDSSGDVIVENTNPFTGEVKQIKYKELPFEATLETLTHTIGIAKKDGVIVEGKVGNTTDTFYPVAGDGVIQGAASTTFSTAHDATTGTLNTAAGEGYSMCRLNGANYSVWRTFQNFDTSSIPDSSVVSAVTSSIYGLANNGASGNHHGVYGSTATDTIVADDFNNGNTTAYSDSPILDTALSTTGYNDVVWNATGIAAISKTGITKICYREVEHDVANSAPTVNQFINFYNSSQTGTTNDPKLIVTHAPVSFIAKINIF